MYLHFLNMANSEENEYDLHYDTTVTSKTVVSKNHIQILDVIVSDTSDKSGTVRIVPIGHSSLKPDANPPFIPELPRHLTIQVTKSDDDPDDWEKNVKKKSWRK